MNFQRIKYFLKLIGLVVLISGCQKTGVTIPGSNSNGSSGVPSNRTTLIQATAQDSIGVSKVEFYVNQQLTCTTFSAPYNCSWNVPPGGGIQYALQTKAYDAQGKVGVSQVVNVTSQ